MFSLKWYTDVKRGNLEGLGLDEASNKQSTAGKAVLRLGLCSFGLAENGPANFAHQQVS